MIKELLDDGVAAGDIAILRYAIAAPGFAYILWRARGLPGLTRGDAARVASAGLLVVVGYHVFLNVGERYTTSGIAALVVALAPGMTMIFAFALGLDRISFERVVGLAVAFVGVAIVVALGTGSDLSFESAKGPLIVLGAPLAFALYNVILKPLFSRYDLLALTAATSLVGMVGPRPVRPRLDGGHDRRRERRAKPRCSCTSASSRRCSGTSSGTSASRASARRVRSRIRTRSPRSPSRSVRSSSTSPSRSGSLSARFSSSAGSRSAQGRLARAAVGYGRAVAERTLSQRELNRALLARQLLLERVRLPIPRALERIGGIQDQYAPNAYIRLWSCLEGFRRDDLTRALERRSVVQATLMRATIHVVSRRDYWPLRGRDPCAAARLVASRAEAATEGARARAPGRRAARADGRTGRVGTRSSSRSSAAAGGWSGRGSSSSAFRPRARGSSGARISSRRRSAGSDRRTSAWTTRSTISSAATSARSGRPQPRTSRSGRA